VNRLGHAEAMVDRWNRRVPSWLEAVSIGLASRVFAIAVLLIAFDLGWPGRLHSWPTPFQMWDGFWYLEIAQRGYHAGTVVATQYGVGFHDFAFFPAWPILIDLLSLGGRLPITAVAVISANALFVLATIPIYRVMERLRNRSYARVGLLLFAFSPAAYVYSADFSEPLFLVAAGLFFLASSPGRSAASAALAMATRLGGTALAAASVADLLKPETRRRGIVTIATVVVAFAAWWLFIAGLTGDPVGYLQGTPAWYSNSPYPVPYATGIASILHGPQPWVSITAVYLLVLAVATAKLIRDGDLRLGFYAAACLASTMLVSFTTMPRLASIAFPAFAALGELLPNHWARLSMFIAFATVEAALALLAVQGILTP
jgi:Mannosyltransferase (PIG-V)